MSGSPDPGEALACAPMLSALGWGALAASSLIIGGQLGLLRDWSNRIIGIVLAFGAGALISAVSSISSRRASGSADAGRWRLGLALAR